MARIENYKHGQFSYADLVSHDMEAITPFYEKLLDWKSQPQDTQGGPPYSLFTYEGKTVAGLGQMMDEMRTAGVPPYWNSYINVDDIQKTVDAAARLGADVVMPPMQIMNAGHMAAFRDPTGAQVCLWQKIDHGGAEYVNDVGGLCWNELVTADTGKARAFYSELFGWEFEKDTTPNGEYWTFKLGDRLNGGMLPIGPQMQGVPPHWSVYFHVPDLKAALEVLKTEGGEVLLPPTETSVGTISVVRDPQGATFDLIQMSVPPDQ